MSAIVEKFIDSLTPFQRKVIRHLADGCYIKGQLVGIGHFDLVDTNTLQVVLKVPRATVEALSSMWLTSHIFSDQVSILYLLRGLEEIADDLGVLEMAMEGHIYSPHRD